MAALRASLALPTSLLFHFFHPSVHLPIWFLESHGGGGHTAGDGDGVAVPVLLISPKSLSLFQLGLKPHMPHGW